MTIKVKKKDYYFLYFSNKHNKYMTYTQIGEYR